MDNKNDKIELKAVYDNNISIDIMSIYCSCSCIDLNYKNLNISKCRERIVQQPFNSLSNIIILGTSKWYNFYHHNEHVSGE